MKQGQSIYQEEFRDAISTVDQDGKRIFLHPTKPKGKFFNYRKIVSIILLVILFGVPFLKVNGQPFLLLDIIDRKFFIFGQLFVPQDFHIFVFGMLLSFVFIVLFTVVWGRIWCGWLCPQTIFMEMVYRQVEYWIEGDAPAQRRLNNSPWNQEKIMKKGAKHAIFVMISILLANMFLSYFIGIERLQGMVTKSPVENWSLFLTVAVLSGLIYYVYARFREQVCTTFCPYGRLQGVFLDKKSVVVSYDHVRGEPRGKLKKNLENTQSLGDCIDCGLCVRVCPTGIDIRNGTQLECVNCTACIDACDSIMDKIGKPDGLVRYASEEEIITGKRNILNARSIAYSVVLLVLLGIMGFMLGTRSTLETTILRAPGQRYQKTDDGRIQNLYTFQVANKRVEDTPFELKLIAPQGELTIIGEESTSFILKGKEITNGAFLVRLTPEELEGFETDIQLSIYSGEQLIENVEINFIGPHRIKPKK